MLFGHCSTQDQDFGVFQAEVNAAEIVLSADVSKLIILSSSPDGNLSQHLL